MIKRDRITVCHGCRYHAGNSEEMLDKVSDAHRKCIEDMDRLLPGATISACTTTTALDNEVATTVIVLLAYKDVTR